MVVGNETSWSDLCFGISSSSYMALVTGWTSDADVPEIGVARETVIENAIHVWNF